MSARKVKKAHAKKRRLTKAHTRSDAALLKLYRQQLQLIVQGHLNLLFDIEEARQMLAQDPVAEDDECPF